MIDSLISAYSLAPAFAVRHGRWKWLAAAISTRALMALANAQADSILSLDFDVNSGYHNSCYAFPYYGDAGYGYHDLGCGLHCSLINLHRVGASSP